jgi:Copper chaperone PCu(A)C
VNRALRAVTIGALLIAPVALSSCSAGQIPQTSTQNRDKVGAMGSVGAIAVREVTLPYPTGGTYPQGGDAELAGAIVNGGSQADQLVSVTGTDFTGVRVSGTGTSPLTTSSALTSVPGTPVGTVAPGGAAAPTNGGASTSSSSAAAEGSSAGGSSSSPSAAGSTTAAGGTTATSTTAAGPTTAATGIAGATGTPTSSLPGSPSQSATGISLVVPPDSTLYLGENTPHVFLTGLKRSLTAGQVVRLTLTFQRAGSVTLDAFVAGPVSYVPNSSSYDFELPSQAQEPGNEAGGGGVGGASEGGNG